MPRNRALAAVALLVATAGAACLLHPRGPADWTGKEGVTIRFTENGFSPQEVYISRGTTVTFVTETGRPFWPASDLHPFHSIYPEFDPKRSLGKNEPWSFVFTKDGHWSYHDHIGLATGAVIVVPPGLKGNPAFDVAAPCDEKEQSGRDACFKQHLELALDKEGIAGALEKIKELHQSYPDFRRNCHLFVHDLGLMAYKKYGENLPQTNKTLYCGQGFYHGYMEGLLAKRKGDMRAAIGFCSKEAVRHGSAYRVLGPQCLHGIGHGSMEYLLTTRHDLTNSAGNLEKLTRIGLGMCSEIGGYDGRFRCASGIFAVLKDWINIQGLAEESADLFSLEDPFRVCKRLSQDWEQAACAWEMSKQALIMASRDAEKTFRAQVRGAGEWQDGEFMPMILASSAFLIGENGVEQSDAELSAYCAPIRDAELRIHCIEGIERGLLFNATPENEATRPARFCLYQKHSEAEKTACAQMLVKSVTDVYGNESLTGACAAVHPAISGLETACETR